MRNHPPYKVLSVDWDFAFPDLFPYDWSFKEAPFFINGLWHLRAGNRNLKTKEIAIEAVRPDESLITGFWPKIINTHKHVPWMIVISETHLDIIHLLKMYHCCDVLNIDAHHDLGYDESLEHNIVDCSNWAAYALGLGLINNYRLRYPCWRREHPEGCPESVKEIVKMAEYGLPKFFREIDIVFVCRSGAWTPPWSDDKWIEFIGGLREINPIAWKRRTVLRDADRAREFNEAEAMRNAKIFEEARKMAIAENKIATEAAARNDIQQDVFEDAEEESD